MKKIALLLFSLFASHSLYAADGFSHQHLKLDLPDGWTAHPADAKAAPHVGTVKSTSIAGTSITLDCYRGALKHTLTSTRIRALKTLAGAYPAGQEQLKKKQKIKTQGGKGIWESWKGYVKAGDMTVALSSPMGMIKTKDCWLVAIGFTAEANAEKLEKDFLAIIKTAR